MQRMKTQAVGIQAGDFNVQHLKPAVRHIINAKHLMVFFQRQKRGLSRHDQISKSTSLQSNHCVSLFTEIKKHLSGLDRLQTQ